MEQPRVAVIGLRSNGESATPPGHRIEEAQPRGGGNIYEDFVKMIKGEGMPLSPAEDAFITTKVLVSLIESPSVYIYGLQKGGDLTIGGEIKLIDITQ